MLKIKHILFPTDFSECAEHAFGQVAHLAAKYGATVHVLNVSIARTEDPDNPINYLDEQERVALFNDGGVYAYEGVPVTYAQEINFSETDGILDYVDRHDIDLVVMGTHCRQGLGHFLLGSVAEEIVRRSSVPVMTVCPDTDAGGRKPIRKILCPVDFSDFSRPALIHAKELAAAYDAFLEVIHIIAEVTLPGVYGVEPVSVAEPDILERVNLALKKEVEDCPGATVPFDTHVFVGFPAHDIADFAAKHEVDLVVLSTHGRTGIRRFFMGSVAENVVRHATCPVLVLKSFGKLLTEAEKPVEESQEN